MGKYQGVKEITNKNSNSNESKKNKCCNCSESTKRQFSVFLPFCAVLVLVILIQSLLIQLVYMQPLQDNIEDAIWGKYKQYLRSIAIGDKVTIMLSYQRVVTPIQSISLFLKKLVVNKVNLADLVNWNPDQNNIFSYRQMKSAQPNFRSVNDYTAADLCPFDAFYQIHQDNKPLLEYKRRQYFGWANWQENIWENLSEEQRDYLLQTDIAMSVGKIIYYNQQFEAIQKYSYYSARQSDDTWYGFHPGERLMTKGRFWNTQLFGGPFSCNLQQDGTYLEYKLPQQDYFKGYDQSLLPCTKNKSGQSCQCPYFDQNRKFPIVWRCRPWYLASAQNAYVTFADAYTDVNTGQLITTCSFKVVTQQLNTIDEETNQSPYMIQSIDLTLGNLQSMYGQGDINEEYSYLVAPSTQNYDTNVGYYNYTAFYHPLNNGTKQTILYLEFANSTKKDEEISQYQEKTQFMLNTNIREDGCNLFSGSSSGIDNEDQSSSSSTDTDQDSPKGIFILKNGTNFYTVFSTIRVCYGNLQQQKSLIVGYLARAISEQRKYQLTHTIRNNLNSMQIVIIVSLVASFFIIFLVLYIVLLQFLKYNFEEPISILSQVIMEAGPQEIHQLQNAIEKGQVRTQLELKNLLCAINNVVISVQKKVQQDLDDNSNSDEQLQELLFKEALSTFQTVEHKLGMGMCLNNIGNIYMRKGDYKTALKLYKSAFLLSQEQYKEEIRQNQEDKQLKNNHEFLITDSTKRNFMRIYACRQYQIGCTLLKAAIFSIKKSDTNMENQINQIIYEEVSANQLITKERDYFINDRIISDEDQNKTLNNNIKSEFSQQMNDVNFSQNRNLLQPSIKNIDEKDKESPILHRRLKNKKSHTEISSQRIATFKNLNAVKEVSDQEIYPKNVLKSDNRKKTLIKINEQNQINEKQNQNQDHDHDQDEIQQNEIVKRISQGMKNSGYENENVFSDRYYQKMQHKLNNSHDNHHPPTNQEIHFDDKNSYLMQAYDLFFDVKSIFDKLGDYCSQSQYLEAYEYYSLSIINLLKLAQCQLLLGSRNFVVKELLNQAKEQIKLKVKRFQNFYANTIPQDVLLQKYYLLKAQLRISEEKYPKCLKNLLQSINFSFDLRTSHESQINQTFDRYHFYDPLESIQCIEMLQILIKKEKINLNPQQKQNLEKDYHYLKEQAERICEPYFFEVFFKDPEQQQLQQHLSQIEQPQQ